MTSPGVDDKVGTTPAPRVTLELPNSTQGPPWPPSEMMDEDGNFIVVGFLIQNKNPVPNQAAIVSKDTPPPLGPDGKEDFNVLPSPGAYFTADYQVVRYLDLQPRSTDLDIVLYNASYGPRQGNFGGGPRIPKEGDSRYNLNSIPPHNPNLFPLGPFETTYTQPRYPLHQAPIWGLDANNRLRSGFEPGIVVDPPGETAVARPIAPALGSDGDETIVGTLNRIAETIDRLVYSSQPSPSVCGPMTFGERRHKPITLRDWLRARGQATITLTRYDLAVSAYTAGRFDLVLSHLLPHAVYITFAIRQASFLPATHPYYRLPDPLGMPNVFVTDGQGNARVSYEMPNPFPDPNNDPKFLRVIGLAVSYKSDYQNWGGRNGLLGPGVGVHIAFNTFADGTFDLAQRFPVLRTVAPRSPVDKALAGIGGAEALKGLKSFSITSTGIRFEPGEVSAPGDDALLVSRFTMELNYDVAGDRLRLDWVRPLDYPVAWTTKYTAIVAGNHGYIQGSDALFSPPQLSNYPMQPTRVASARKQQYLLNPHVMLRAVAEDPSLATVHADQVYQGRNHHVISVPGPGEPVLLFIDVATGTISKLTTAENDYSGGDAVIAVHFANWQSAGESLRFPMQLELTVSDRPRGRSDPLQRETRNTVVVNPELASSLFALPRRTTPNPEEARRGELNAQWYQRFLSLGFPLDQTQIYVQAQRLSQGVYFLAGGSHNSLAVELADSVIIIDTPLYEARSLAVIDWVKESFHKPISHVINTHFHTDHTGGLRTYVAIGAIVITAALSVDFINKLLTAPHTVFPDTLQQHPKEAVIHTVPSGGLHAIQDNTNPIEVRHVTSSHATDMLVAYLPRTKLLFNVDMWAPGQILPEQPLPTGFYATGARQLYDAIRLHTLEVQTIAGGHGGVGPFGDLARRFSDGDRASG